MSQKGSFSKKQLKELIPKIENEIKGEIIRCNKLLTTSELRQIANKFKVDTGLVIKVRGGMNPLLLNTLLKENSKEVDMVKQEQETKIKDKNKEVDSNFVCSKITKTLYDFLEEEKDNVCLDYMTNPLCNSRNKLAVKYNTSEYVIKEILKSRNITSKDKAKNVTTKNPNASDISTVIITLPVKAKEEKLEEDNMKKNNKKMSPIRNRDLKPNSNVVNSICTIKFVTDLPVYDIKNDKFPKQVIWCISKNRSPADLREDVTINSKKEFEILNSFRNRYYFVTINDGILRLIDFFDVTNQEFVQYAHKACNTKFENEDGIISNEEVLQFISETVKYDKTIERTRLGLNDFEFNPDRFTELQKIFGFDNFSFNIASKNNSETVEAGLIADRHPMPVNKFIFPESFDQELMFNYPEQERIVRDFIRNNFDFDEYNNNKIKQLKLYVSGMQCAYGAVMKVCIDMGVNLITMHYNAKTGSYVPQYINGNIEDTGGYIKAFEKITSQKNLKGGEILLFNCTYENFMESNVDTFYIMEASRMINNSGNSQPQKGESVIVVIKNKEDIWRLYPTILDNIVENTDKINLALWVTKASIKGNILNWGMNIIKSFNYK